MCWVGEGEQFLGSVVVLQPHTFKLYIGAWDEPTTGDFCVCTLVMAGSGHCCWLYAEAWEALSSLCHQMLCLIPNPMGFSKCRCKSGRREVLEGIGCWACSPDPFSVPWKRQISRESFRLWWVVPGWMPDRAPLYPPHSQNLPTQTQSPDTQAVLISICKNQSKTKQKTQGNQTTRKYK